MGKLFNADGTRNQDGVFLGLQVNARVQKFISKNQHWPSAELELLVQQEVSDAFNQSRINWESEDNAQTGQHTNNQ